VQLAAVDAELLDRPQDQLGHEAGPVGIEEPQEGPAHPVVVEHTGIHAVEAEDRGAEGIGPLTERVDRLAVQDEVSHDDTEHDRRGDLQPAIVVGNVAFEELAFGHVRQLDRLSGELLTRAWSLGAGPGGEPMTIDIDSTIQ